MLSEQQPKKSIVDITLYVQKTPILYIVGFKGMETKD